MLDPKLHEKMNLAYAKVGDIGYDIALNLRIGKDFIRKQKELWENGIKILQICKLLFAHVDTSTSPPTLYNITEAQVNYLVNCLDKIGKLDRLPIVPTALPSCKPIKINSGSTGATGPAGANGTNGTNANIIVEPDSGETTIVVSSVDVGLVKHYKLKLDVYKAPAVLTSVIGAKIYEIGVIVATKTINLITTKGSKPVTALILSDSVLNTQLQGVLNLVTINGVTQPVTSFVTDSNVSVDKTYQATINDGTNTVTTQDFIHFYYPILYGSNAIVLTTTHYTALTKLIQAKGNFSMLYNAVDNYFYVAFPSSYGTAIIRDQNGFDVTSLFTSSLINVTSSGLDNNWTVEYRVYRTTAITDIASKTYNVTFV